MKYLRIPMPKETLRAPEANVIHDLMSLDVVDTVPKTHSGHFIPQSD